MTLFNHYQQFKQQAQTSINRIQEIIKIIPKEYDHAAFKDVANNLEELNVAIIAVNDRLEKVKRPS